MKTSSVKSRHLVRAAANAGAVKTSGGRGAKPLLRLSPREYLHHALLNLGSFGFHPAEELVVQGSIHLRDTGDLRFHLPEARVTGNVRLENCPGLLSCELDAEGALVIAGCPSLCAIRGGARRVHIRGSGLRSIGADFESRGKMMLDDSPLLCRLNCPVGGSLLVRGSSGGVRLGPAFKCQGSMVLPEGSGAGARD